MKLTQINGFRLSQQQVRLWTHGKTFNQLQAHAVIEIRGDLDVNRLKEALNAVCANHEILRTVFHGAAGLTLPLQEVVDESGFNWTETSGADTDLRGQVANLETGPVLQAVLHKHNDRSELHLILPAVCADQTTLVNLYQALAESYDDPNMEVDEEELVQYLDFSEWQHEVQEDEEDAAEGFAFWNQLCPRDLSLTRLSARNGEGAFASSAHTVSLDPAYSDALLRGAWVGLTQRMTNDTVVVVNHVVNGRIAEDFESALGPFDVVVPVSKDLSEDVAPEQLGELLNQQLEEITENLEYYRFNAESTADAGLTFDHLNAVAPVTAAGATFTLKQTDVDPGGYQILLRCQRHADGGLTGTFHYDTRLFQPAWIAALADTYQTLLARADETPVQKMDLASAEQRRGLSETWNQRSAEYPKDQLLHQVFEQQAAETPDHIAVQHGDQSLTYAALNRRANQLANLLSQRGAGPDTLVGVCLERNLDMVATVLGILKTGAAFMPLDADYPQERLEFMLSEAAMLVSVAETAARFAHLDKPTLLLDSESEAVNAQSDGFDNAAGHPRAAAYVIYTSGSTGRPKGVLICHQSAMNYLTWAGARYQADQGKGVPLHSSLSFDLTITSLFLPLFHGKTIHIVDQERAFEGLAEMLREHGDFSLIKLTPLHLRLLEEWLPPDKVAQAAGTLVVGGEALAAEDVAYWRKHAPSTQIINEYGPTEATVGCCIHQVGDESGGIPIGIPGANTSLYLLDGQGQRVPMGVPGELFIGGDALALGYLNRPDITAERFQPDPFSKTPGARLYQTGDLARFTHADTPILEFLGRNDHQIKVRGYRIEPGEIEAGLKQHEDIRDAVVIAAGNRRDLRLVAYYVSSMALHVDALRDMLAEHLPDYMVPATFVHLRFMPLTTNGKVDRAALPEPGHDRPDLGGEYVAPRTPVEADFVEIFKTALDVEKVGIYDSFFNLGGDSIRSVRAVALAREKGYVVTIAQIFEHRHVAELVQHLDSQSNIADPLTYVKTEPFGLISETDRAALPEGVVDAYPLSAVQLGMLYHMLEKDDAPSPPTYHNVSTFMIRVPFNPDTFRKAVDRVVARHAILRTSFDLGSYSEPLQLVHAHAEMPIEVNDVRAKTEAEKEAVIEAFIQDENFRLIDISNPPLLRFNIQWLDDDRINLNLTEPHSISDGWSTHLTLVEIFDNYLAMHYHRPLPDAEPLEVTFRDFIRMEQAAQKSESVQNFWKRKLGECSSAKLPLLPKGLQPEAGLKDHKHYMAVDPNLIEKLFAVSKRADVPFKSVLLAAHLRVVGLILGRTDITTGLVFHGRPEIEGGEVVRGLFLNTLPFPMRLTGGSWIDLCRAVYAAEGPIITNRRYPLSNLQAAYGKQALFETAFAHHHFYSVSDILKDGEIEVLETSDLSRTNFDFIVSFNLNPILKNHLMMVLEGSLERLTKDQLLTWFGFYERVLKDLGENPDAPYDRTSYLSQSQLECLAAWSGTADTQAAATTIHGAVRRFATETPDRTALMQDDTNLSYAALMKRADQITGFLQGAGVVPGDRVGVYIPSSTAQVEAMLGVLQAGAACVLLDADHSTQAVADKLNHAGVKILLTHSAHRDQAPSQSVRVVCVDADRALIDAADAPAEVPLSSDAAAFLFYPEGATKEGLTITHANFSSLLESATKPLAINADDIFGIIHGVVTQHSVWEIWAPLTHGAKLLFAPENLRQSAENLPTFLMDRKVTVLCQSPSVFSAFLGHESHGNYLGRTQIRLLIFSEEPVSAESLGHWFKADESERPQLVNVYSGGVGVPTTMHLLTAEDHAGGFEKIIGQPLPGRRIVVLDVDGNPAPIGTRGELCIDTRPGIGHYHDRDDLNNQRFLNQDGSRLFRSGETGRFLPNGTLEYFGPIENDVVVDGNRLMLSEINATLLRVPGVREARILVKTTDAGSQLIAYVSPVPGKNIVGSVLRGALEQALPHNIKPRVVELDTLPMTAQGNLDVDALPEPSEEQTQKFQAFISPRTETEQKVASIWKEVLHVTEVGVTDNFFDLGGNSLLVFQLHAKLNAVFPGKISVVEIFKYTTVAALAEVLDRTEDTTSAPEARTTTRATTRSRRIRRDIFDDDDLDDDEDF